MKRKLCAYATVVLGSTCLPAIALAQGNHTATLLFDAYNPTGAGMSISDFVDCTHYIASTKWQLYSNYGFFQMGTQPGFFHINTTALANGVHTISWNAFDNLGRGEGLGSRYFNVVNTGGSVAAPEEEIPNTACWFAMDLPSTVNLIQSTRIPMPSI